MSDSESQVEVGLYGVTKRFGDTIAVDDVTIEVAPGEFFSLLGPSGCGKTTSLRMIAGFEEPDEGRVVLTGRDIVLRRDSHDVTVGGAAIELTSKEFDLLACFLEHPGIVLSREKLLDLVWGMTYPGGTRTVDVHVAQLRRKLGDPDSIRTVRGAGYKLTAA